MDFDTKAVSAELINRLVEYASIDTQSAHDIPRIPSTNKQKKLGRLLVEQLREIGLNAEMDRWGYVYAYLPSNRRKGSKKIPPLGFIAHLDATPDAPGGDVHPIVHENYKGGNLKFKRRIIVPATDLEGYVGDTIITSDGTTLLAADDKNGIAEIVTGIRYIINSNIKHGDIYLLFNTDEEIATQLKKLTPNKFPVRSAYTFDGGGGSNIENETFNAAKATITFKGDDYHPGMGGFQKRNAIDISDAYAARIPATQKPETTLDRFGFFYSLYSKGTPLKAKRIYEVRDFDKNGLKNKLEFLRDHGYNLVHGPRTVIVRIEHQYPNMKYKLDRSPQVVRIALNAAEKAGVKPRVVSLRGGTDGAAATIKYNKPCPNIFCGFHNEHKVNEWASVREMVNATQTWVYIVEKHRDYHLRR